MESSESGKKAAASPATTAQPVGAPSQRSMIQIGPARPRITLPGPGSLRRLAAPSGPIDAEHLAERYGREAQLAFEGLIYLGVRLPFRLMATLVEAGRKFEDEYTGNTPKRRVPPYDEER